MTLDTHLPNQTLNSMVLFSFGLCIFRRYDHFAVLCELLPTAVPSLVLNILAVVSGSLEESQTFQVASKVLNCPGRLNPEALKTDPHQFELRRCNFPGTITSMVYHLIRDTYYYFQTKL